MLLVACAGSASVPTPASPGAIVDRSAASAAIARELDDFHDAAAHADEARYFAHFSDDAVFLGTDATERWDAAAFHAFAHPHFAAGKAWSFHATRRAITVSADGRFGYFDEDLATEKLGPARGSGVVVLRDGGWKIAQYNLAIVVPNERFAELRALLERPAAPPADAGKRTQ
jgi:ketosteroid isomerase-like protein